MTRVQDETRIIDATAVAMRRKLREHEGKGPWTDNAVEGLMFRLGEELVEFVAAVEGDMSVRDVEDEGADVQNFVAMIVDVYRRARTKAPKRPTCGNVATWGEPDEGQERCRLPYGHALPHLYGECGE